MKKRTLALLLATLLLLTMAFAGCSGGGESSTSEASTSGEPLATLLPARPAARPARHPRS